MIGTESDALRAAILARYRSVYAFCKAHQGKIGKSVVVQILAGKYPGNVERQTARIRSLINGFDPVKDGMPAPERIYEALQRVACGQCGRRGARKRRYCRACKSLWREQTIAILTLAGAKEE